MPSGPFPTPDLGTDCPQSPAGDAAGAWAMRLLARETRVSPGRIPRDLGGRPILPATSRLDGDCYVLRTDNGLGFCYRRGEGITVEHAPGADLSEESLWLHGSIYAAVASINGLMPIHASAVVHAGRVYAFTGQSGVGKSTLVAALGERSLPMFADDTLVLDLSDPERVICLPGHKRLKLSAQAIALTGAEQQEKVSAGIDKFYARPASASDAAPLPLAELIFLDQGDRLAISPISGGAGIARLADDHYTTDLFARAQQLDRAALFALRARLAGQIVMSSLTRPYDIARFAASAELATRHIRSPAPRDIHESPAA
jgi:hypothetical protein